MIITIDKKELKPFPHKIIDNFLSPSEYIELSRIYHSLQFTEQKTDLFHISQSTELNNNNELSFFINKINNIFNKYSYNYNDNSLVEGDTYITIFASFYSRNQYLLPHDDMVETRIQAFTYYLEDCIDSKLTLFENDGLTIYNKIDVIKNRLVIFDVSPISFHEVENSSTGGRKAFTGWLNFSKEVDFKKHSEKSCFSNLFKYKQDTLIQNIKYFPFNLDFINIEYNIIEDVEFPFSEFINKRQVGPVTSRRITELEYKEINLPNFGKVSKCNIFEIKKYDYILLEEMNSNVLDVFIFNCKDNISNKYNSIIFIKDGEKVFNVPLINNSMHIIKRGNMSWFLKRSLIEYNMLHVEYII